MRPVTRASWSGRPGSEAARSREAGSGPSRCAAGPTQCVDSPPKTASRSRASSTAPSQVSGSLGDAHRTRVRTPSEIAPKSASCGWAGTAIGLPRYGSGRRAARAGIQADGSGAHRTVPSTSTALVVGAGLARVRAAVPAGGSAARGRVPGAAGGRDGRGRIRSAQRGARARGAPRRGRPAAVSRPGERMKISRPTRRCANGWRRRSPRAGSWTRGSAAPRAPVLHPARPTPISAAAVSSQPSPPVPAPPQRLGYGTVIPPFPGAPARRIGGPRNEPSRRSPGPG